MISTQHIVCIILAIKSDLEFFLSIFRLGMKFSLHWEGALRLTLIELCFLG